MSHVWWLTSEGTGETKCLQIFNTHNLAIIPSSSTTSIYFCRLILLKQFTLVYSWNKQTYSSCLQLDFFTASWHLHVPFLCVLLHLWNSNVAVMSNLTNSIANLYFIVNVSNLLSEDNVQQIDWANWRIGIYTDERACSREYHNYLKMILHIGLPPSPNHTLQFSGHCLYRVH